VAQIRDDSEAILADLFTDLRCAWRDDLPDYAETVKRQIVKYVTTMSAKGGRQATMDFIYNQQDAPK